MKLRARSLFAVSLLVFTGCAGTAQSPDGTELQEEPAEDELSASCKYPRRYIAVVEEGSCAEIPAHRGRWVPSPLFPDAPEGSGTCVYTWSGERYARVDREELRTRIVYPGSLMASCGADPHPDIAEVVEIPDIHPDTGMVGAVGCDVCGTHRDGKIWVVLPPERINWRELQVKLSSGATRSFRINAAEGARSMAITLPPPPAGTTYVNGRLRVQ